jgi:hypothetical protein
VRVCGVCVLVCGCVCVVRVFVHVWVCGRRGVWVCLDVCVGVCVGGWGVGGCVCVCVYMFEWVCG